jgi:hypothetical protein
LVRVERTADACPASGVGLLLAAPDPTPKWEG